LHDLVNAARREYNDLGKESIAMNTITLPAHFDGEQIRLDVPFALEPHTRLLVTILQQTPSETLEASAELLSEQERTIWALLSSAGLNAAYGDGEPEYALDLITEKNPDYAGG